MKKKLLMIGIVGVCAVGGTGVCVYTYNEANAFELKSDKVSIELGDTLNANVADYINGGKKALASVTLDFSEVDTENVGTYTAYANYRNKELSFIVEVEDTTAPDVKFVNNGEFKIIAGETLSGNDIVDDMSDLSGIASVTFSDGVTVNKEEKDLLSAITLSYDTEGIYDNTVIITDNNGNATEKRISIRVVEDYAKHVSGFHDWTVEQNAEIDFTKGVEADERIISVEANELDLSQTGEYELVYSIVGDDNETTIEHSVIVTVVDASTAQTMANNGEIVYIDGNNTKDKESKNAEAKSQTIEQETNVDVSTDAGMPSNSLTDSLPVGWSFSTPPIGVTWDGQPPHTSYWIGYEDIYFDENMNAYYLDGAGNRIYEPFGGSEIMIEDGTCRGYYYDESGNQIFVPTYYYDENGNKVYL